MQAHGAHQARHRAASDFHALPLQLQPNLAYAIDLEILCKHPSYRDLQGQVAPSPLESFEGSARLAKVAL
jgi:hypothetical protein